MARGSGLISRAPSFGVPSLVARRCATPTGRSGEICASSIGHVGSWWFSIRPGFAAGNSEVAISDQFLRPTRSFPQVGRNSSGSANGERAHPLDSRGAMWMPGLCRGGRRSAAGGGCGKNGEQMKMFNVRLRLHQHQRHEKDNNHDRHVGCNRHGPLAGAAVVEFVQTAFVLVVMDDTEIERDAQVQEGNDLRYATPRHDTLREFASATSESQGQRIVR